MKYYLRETWIMRGAIGGIEKYDESSTKWNTAKDLKEVKKKMKEWIETWKENAEENDYKFLRFKTDNKTFATCWIKKESATDTFKLKVVDALGVERVKRE